MYQYQFSSSCYPTATIVTDDKQPGYIVFDDGSAVDWTSKYYDGSVLQNAVYNYEVADDGNASFVSKGAPADGYVQSATAVDIGGKIYVNGAWIDRPETTPGLDDLKAMKYADIRSQLASTDYECLKFVDGALTADQYAPVKEKRETLRIAFNAIQTASTIEEVQAVKY